MVKACFDTTDCVTKVRVGVLSHPQQPERMVAEVELEEFSGSSSFISKFSLRIKELEFVKASLKQLISDPETSNVLQLASALGRQVKFVKSDEEWRILKSVTLQQTINGATSHASLYQVGFKDFAEMTAGLLRMMKFLRDLHSGIITLDAVVVAKLFRYSIKKVFGAAVGRNERTVAFLAAQLQALFKDKCSITSIALPARFDVPRGATPEQEKHHKKIYNVCLFFCASVRLVGDIDDGDSDDEELPPDGEADDDDEMVAAGAGQAAATPPPPLIPIAPIPPLIAGGSDEQVDANYSGRVENPSLKAGVDDRSVGVDSITKKLKIDA